MLANLLQEFASPLSREQVNKIRDALGDLSLEQVNWLSGYLSGLSATASAAGLKDIGAVLTAPIPSAAEGQVADSLPKAKSVEQKTATILFGSQTGNARGVAEQLQSRLQSNKASGTASDIRLVDMAEYNPKQLKKEHKIWLIVSTHGEGEPPDDAIELYEFLDSKKAPDLSGIEFAVLALGDSSYEYYCQTGKDFDLRLEKLGATRVLERLDCDVDYYNDSEAWAKKIVAHSESSSGDFPSSEELRPHLSVVEGRMGNEAASDETVSNKSAPKLFTKFNPFSADVVDVFPITTDNSIKPTYHIEFNLEGSGLTYQPGDALGVWPVNDYELVSETLSILGLSPDESVIVNDNVKPLSDALRHDFELTQVAPALVEAICHQVNSEVLNSIVAEKSRLHQLLSNHQVPELLRKYPASFSAADFISKLRRITPRLYSIASSQDDVDEEVHLTVGLVVDERDGVEWKGAASCLLAQLSSGDTARVFIEPNKNFKLPKNAQANIIMIGAGTGVAPYRSFIQQRAFDGASGSNWLVFGNTHFHSDFLYQTEWQQWLKKGVLNRVDLAFSRDQAEKIYVQHRLLENAAEIYQWLEQGAHVYLCGDSERLGKSVESTLIEILSTQGSMSSERAKQKLIELRKAGRYQKDVY